MTIEAVLRKIIREELERVRYGSMSVSDAESDSPRKPSTAGKIWLTTREAAEISGFAQKSLNGPLISGELHGYQRAPGSHWRIDRDCLAAWIAGDPCGHQGSK